MSKIDDGSGTQNDEGQEGKSILGSETTPLEGSCDHEKSRAEVKMARAKIPEHFRSLVMKVFDLGVRSPTKAIKAHCLECMGWDQGAKQAVRNCTDKLCFLHDYRPYRAPLKKNGGLNDGEN